MLPAAPAPLFYGHGRQSAEAAERSLAVVLIQHLNRRADADDAIARIADSQAFPQVARSVLLWGPDPSDPEGYHGSTKVLTRAKGNAALAVGAAPVAADPGAPGPTFPERPSSRNPQHDVEADGTVAIVLGGVLLFVVIAGPLFGAESRPAWRNVDRKPSFRMVGSMRPEDWPPSEFKR